MLNRDGIKNDGMKRNPIPPIFGKVNTEEFSELIEKLKSTVL